MVEIAVRDSHRVVQRCLKRLKTCASCRNAEAALWGVRKHFGDFDDFISALQRLPRWRGFTNWLARNGHASCFLDRLSLIAVGCSS